MEITNPIYKTVLQMMSRFGGDGVLIVPGEPEYDVETSSAVSVSVNYPIRYLVFDYLQKQSGISADKNSIIQNGDKQVFIKPYEGLPKPVAKTTPITIADGKYSVVTVKEINPSGSNIYLYECFLRR